MWVKTNSFVKVVLFGVPVPSNAIGPLLGACVHFLAICMVLKTIVHGKVKQGSKNSIIIYFASAWATIAIAQIPSKP